MTQYTINKQGRQLSRKACTCGWHGPAHRTGKRPVLVVCTPLLCPKCGRRVAETTCFYR